MDSPTAVAHPEAAASDPAQPRGNPLLREPERARVYAEIARAHFEHVQSTSDRLVGHAERVIATAGALAAFTAVFVPEDELTDLGAGDWRSLLLFGAFALLGLALSLGIFSLRLHRQAGYPHVFDLQLVFAQPGLDVAGIHKRIGDALLKAAAFNRRLNASRASRLRWASITLLLALLLTLAQITASGSAL